MQLEINARHWTMGDDQRELFEAAAEKLIRFSPRPVNSLKMTINHEAGRFFADSVLHLKSTDFRAKAEEREPEVAVAEMVENLRKQLAKFKGKTSGKQKGEEGGLGRALPVGFAGGDGGGDDPQGFVLKDMDVSTAKESFQGSDGPFLVFRNVANSRVAVIYRRDDGGLGHMESQGD